MATSAERMRKHVQGLREKGMVKVQVWVHAHQASDATIALGHMAANPELEIRTLTNSRTGRIASIR